MRTLRIAVLAALDASRLRKGWAMGIVNRSVIFGRFPQFLAAAAACLVLANMAPTALAGVDGVDGVPVDCTVVTTTTDSGPGSLRDVLACVPNGGTITFDPSLNGQTILLRTIGDGTFGPSALLVSNLTVTIDGGTLSVTISQDITNSPTGGMRIFYVTSNGNLTLRNLTISGGLAQGGNGAPSGGGAAGLGGAIVNAGTLQLVQCTLTANQAQGGSDTGTNGGGGGGLGGNNSGGNGGAPNSGSSGGTSSNGGNGGFGGGGGFGVTGGTGGFGGGGGLGFDVVGGNGGFGGGGGGDGGNAGFGGGTGPGGGAGLGGAVFNYGGAVFVANSTLAGNSAVGGIGLDNGSGYGGAIFNLNGTVTALNSTLASNVAPQGGGAIYSLGDNGIATQSGPALSNTAATVTLGSSILAGSTDTNGIPVSEYIQNTNDSGQITGHAFGTVSSSGAYNIIQTPATTGGFSGSATTANPLLGPLQNNGGPTFTMAPLCGSPAIDAGTNVSGSATDQRGIGFARTVDIAGIPNAPGGDGTDIGAVEVQVDIALTITCPSNVTVQCASQVPASDFAGGSVTGGCGQVTVTWGGDSDIAPPSPCSRYTLYRTYIAVDSLGDSNSCEQTITVANNTPPTITAFPSNVTVQCASQVPAANDASVSATAYCAPFAFISHDPDSISGQTCSDRYTITRTYHASDGCNNTVSSNQTITVNDSTPPTITCPATVTTNTDPGQCTASGVVLGNPTTLDNCGGTATLNNNAPSPFPAGTNTVVWTATDPCGSSATCTQLVIVVDNQPPTIVCPSNILVQCASQVPPPDFAGGSVTDNCGLVTVTWGGDFTNFNVNLTSLGATIHPEIRSCANHFTITRTYIAVDSSGNSNTCQQTIRVNDTTLPTITVFPSNVTVQCASQVPAADNSLVSVTAPCGGLLSIFSQDSISGQSCPNRYTITRTYHVEDDSCNSVSSNQTITVNDTTPPTITCPAMVMTNTDPGQCYASTVNLGKPTGSDNCGGTMTLINNAPSPFPAGTNAVVWTATDDCGNSATCTQLVIVVGGQPVTLLCPSNITVQCASQVPPPDFAGGSVTGGCGQATVTWGGDFTNNFNPVSLGPPVQRERITCANHFTITRTYIAVDSSGNTNTCQQTIRVNDTTLPTITAFPSNVTVQCASQVPPANDGSVSASGSCGSIVNISHDPDSISGQTCPNRYTITRTYHVVDASCNRVSSNQTITVYDTTPPTITCPATVTTNTDPGQCYASTVVLGSPTPLDNCGGTVTLINNAPSPFPTGTNAVVWTATDNCGNSATCTQLVIVVNNQPLTINNCPANIISNTAPGECGATVSWSAPTVTNNCGATVTVVCVPPSGSFFGQGTSNVTCTASDGQGHTTNCSFNVTVTQPAGCSITVSGNSNGSTTICQGNSLILTAANGMKSYLWSGPEQSGATVRTIVVGTAGTYYCTQQQYYGPANCCSVTITVNPPPNATITGNLVITNGLPTTLVGPSGLASQYWTGPQNNGLGSQSNTVSLAGTYTLHVTDSNGCQNTGSVTVQNRTPAPCSITVSGDAGDLTICQGTTSILTGANGMSSYLWSGPEQSGATAKSIRVGTQGTYTVQQIDGTGLTNSCSVFITVHPLPDINIFGTRTFCQGTNTTLYGPPGMSQYLWLGPQNNGRNTQSNTVSLAGTYTLVITDTNGCQNSLAVPVTTIPCP